MAEVDAGGTNFSQAYFLYQCLHLKKIRLNLLSFEKQLLMSLQCCYTLKENKLIVIVIRTVRNEKCDMSHTDSSE